VLGGNGTPGGRRLAFLLTVLRKLAGSGGMLVLARLVSPGAAPKLSIARKTPTEQRAKATKTRGLKKADWELGFFCMTVFSAL
jgi:hypothetical protein